MTIPGIERKVLRLRRRVRQDSLVGLGNFVLGTGKTIDFGRIWRRHPTELSPFCIDIKRNEVVFVRVASGVDLTTVPFFYHAQRQHAITIYSITFDQLCEFAEELTDDAPNVGFLFSTGRCGSTLLLKLLESSPEVMAISEPDIYTQVIVSDLADDDVVKVIRSTTRVLSEIYRHHRPSAKFLFIKLRSQCVYRGDLFRRALPRSRNVFLYRNAIDVVNSFYSLLPSLLRTVFHLIPIDRWIASRASVKPRISLHCPLLSDARFRDIPPSGINILVLMWLSAMACALRLRDADGTFFQVMLRYEDLVMQRADVLAPVFERCDLKPANAGQFEQVFATDSQTGSRMASRGLKVLNRAQEQRIRKIIAMHPQIDTPEFQFDDDYR